MLSREMIMPKCITLRTSFSVLLAVCTPVIAQAQSITIQGRVSNGNGQPVNGSATQFRVKILTPNSNLCTLYDETQTIDLSQSGGLFSLTLNNGSGVINAPTTYPLEVALSNRSGFSVNSSYCDPSAGTGMITYSPLATDNRKVIVSFKDPGTMTGYEAIPTMDLDPVAYAIESRSIGGYPAGSLLRIDNAGIPGSAATMNSSQFSELQALVNGSSLNYMSSTGGSTTGARLPTVSGNPATPANGSIWFDTSSGQIKYYSGGSVQTVGSGTGSGTITGVTAGAGLTGGGTAGTVALALSNSGVTAATYGSASSVPVIQVDSFGRITLASTTAIAGTLPSGSAGQFLRSDGSAWSSQLIRMGDLKNAAGTGALFTTASCNSSQSLYWNSGTDEIKCQAIGDLDASALTTGIISSARLPASATFWSNASGGINYAGGNVGIGTTTPSAKLEISGTLKIADGAESCSGTGGGMIRYIGGNLQFCNGSAWQTLGISGAGLTSLGGQIGSSQTFANGSAGTAPAFSSGSNVHTLNIPMASTASVTAGLLSKLDYDAFSAKLGASTTFSGDISGNYSAMSVDKVKGTPITISSLTASNFLKFDGSAWVNSMIDASDLSSGTLASARMPAFTGDAASMAGSTVLTLSNSGAAAGTYKSVTVDSKGRVTAGSNPTDIAGYGITDAVKNLAGTKSFTTDATGTKPAGQVAGRFYIDVANKKISYDDGSAWTDIAGSTAAGFSGSLAGDVTGSQGATVVANVGGSTAANVNAATILANAATSGNSASTIVKRDASGNYSAGAVSQSSAIFRDGTANTVSLAAPASVSSSYSLTLPPAKATVAGQVLSSDTSGVLSWATPVAATSVAVTAPITNSGTATAPNIGIPAANGTIGGYLTSSDFTAFTNKLSSALNSAMIFVGNASNTATGVALTGDATLSNAGALSITKIRGTSVSAAAPTFDGQVLRFDGTSFVPNFVRMADLRSTVAGTSAITGSCTAAQTLTWVSGSDNLQCQNIGIAAATQISGILPIANGGTGANSTAQNLVFAGPSSGSGAPSFRALAAADLPASASYWNAATGGINYSGGNVGINTPAPGARLEIAGSQIVNNGTITVYSNGNAANNNYWRNFYRARGTYASPLVNTDGDEIGSLAWGAHDGTSYVPGARIGSTVEGAIATGSVPASLRFYTGSNSGGTERMHISPSGLIGIGTAAPVSKLHIGAAPTASANYGLFSLGTAPFDGSTAGFFAGNANGTFESINAASGYNGDFVNYQVAGVSKLKIDAAGNISAAGSFNSGAQTSNGAINFNTSGSGVTNIGTGSNTGAVTLGNASNIVTLAGPTSVTSSTASTSSTTGALKVAGGMGVSGDIFAGASVNAATQMMAPQIYGSSTASGTLKLDGTSNVTKGYLLLNSAGGNVGIGTTAPNSQLHIYSASTLSTVSKIENTAAPTQSSSYLILKSDTGSSGNIYRALIGQDAAGTNRFAVGSFGGGEGDITLNTGSSLTERMRILSTGNVGIGTTSPTAPLSVVRNSGTTGTNLLRLMSDDTWNSNFILSNQSTGAHDWSLISTGQSNSYGVGKFQIFDNTAAAIRMTIDTAGNVGIGTTSPEYPLSIAKNDAAANMYIENSSSSTARYPGITLANYATGTSGYPGFSFMNANGSRSSTQPTSTGQTLGVIQAYGVTDTSNTWGWSAAMNFLAEETFSSTARGSAIQFLTTSPGTVTGGEKMRITGSGNVGVGTANPLRAVHVTTSSSTEMIMESTAIASGTVGRIWRTRLDPTTGNFNIDTLNATLAAGATIMTMQTNGNVGVGTTSPSARLHVAGNLRVQGSTDCTLGNGAGGTNCSSDIRLKSNLTEIENSLEKILSLRGVEFNWNEKSQSPGRHDIGVIAQDVEKVFPTAVMEDPQSGYKKVDYAVLVAPVIQSLKALNQRVLYLFSTSKNHSEDIANLKAQNAVKDRAIASMKAEIAVAKKDAIHAWEAADKAEKKILKKEKELDEVKDRLVRIEKMLKPN